LSKGVGFELLLVEISSNISTHGCSISTIAVLLYSWWRYLFMVEVVEIVEVFPDNVI
jgi:hypothetical protein